MSTTEWTQSEIDRKAQAEAGHTVVANQRQGADQSLIAWAKERDLLVKIDRRTK